MKRIISVAIAMILVSAAWAGASAQTLQDTLQQVGRGYQGMGRGMGGCVDPDTILAQFDYQELSQEEIDNLLHMRGEEKLARDVYLTLSETWKLPVFRNIPRSEQRHCNAVKALLTKYKLDDPYVDDTVGVFADATFTNLYNELVATGRTSLIDALTVGAIIEDLDLVDLENALAQTDNLDIQFVYQNLSKGSRNHLRAFVRLLRRFGVSYTPRYLDMDTYQDIINSPKERGYVYDDQGKKSFLCGRKPQ
ncbi:hypothetical protein PN36_28360 [Candidatus Thiomargarita nelsonii]|uniref:DUF2202 domain-containing protein n=1 Tax=Candidatus Thiomargarita nelsonii TaxID=1003181 RepID=A0A4E0REA6_9GAMM|nr:hypothetical protein PN36_28360 [Candidatus Thiomargarita nelsonii]